MQNSHVEITLWLQRGSQLLTLGSSSFPQPLLRACKERHRSTEDPPTGSRQQAPLRLHQWGQESKRLTPCTLAMRRAWSNPLHYSRRHSFELCWKNRKELWLRYVPPNVAHSATKRNVVSSFWIHIPQLTVQTLSLRVALGQSSPLTVLASNAHRMKSRTPSLSPHMWRFELAIKAL